MFLITAWSKFLVRAVSIFVFAIFVFSPMVVLAADTPAVPVMAVNIGNTHLTFQSIHCNPGQTCDVGWIREYIVAVYQYGIGLAAVLAVIMIMIGGFLWLTSAGNSSMVGRAKEFITSAIVGLLLALFSYIILYSINPSLTTLPLTTLQEVNILPGFGSAAAQQAEVAANSVPSGTSQPAPTGIGNVTGLDSDVQQLAGRYGAYVTSPYRAGDQRHDSGRVFDASFRNPQLNSIIMTTGQRISDTLPNGSHNPDAPTWGTAYRMPDGSIWVDERPSGSNPEHWHVEVPGGPNNYPWVANLPH